MRAIWGTKRKLRCRDIVLTLFVQGHLVDPRQACVYQSLCALRRNLRKYPELTEVVRKCWHACVIDGIDAPGPIGILCKHVRAFGWSWHNFDYIELPGRGRLPLVLGPDSWWHHRLREGLRCHLWCEAASRRNDMDGLQAVQGIDRKATMKLLSKKLPADEVGMLRSVLSGSIRLQKRLRDAKIAKSPVCVYCGMCDETVRHCIWECPRWAYIRDMFDLPDECVRSMWPACTIDCGIFVEDQRIIALDAGLEQEEEIARDIRSHFGCAECRAQVAASHDVQELQVIWTDGASSNNQDHRFRRAGSGIYYDVDHDMNFRAMCPGLFQSNQRAELLAVVLACLRDPRPLDIRSDSEYVCNSFQLLQGLATVDWQGDHADLWNLLGNELASRSSVVQVSWVKGHAKQVDITRGRSTKEDKEGNDGADALAVAGAKLHAIPSEVLEAARQRIHWATSVQQMMVTVLKARFLAEQGLTNGADMCDRGSDNDCFSDNEDCEEFLDDESCLTSEHCSHCSNCIDCMGAHLKQVIVADDGCPGNGTCLDNSVSSSLGCIDCIDCVTAPCDGPAYIASSPDDVTLSSMYTSDCADCIGLLDDAIVTGPGIVTDTEHQHSRVGAVSDTEHSFAILTCTNTLHDGLTSL